MKKDTACVLVGTSGWSYEHWRGLFYPANLRRKDWLGFYASRLATAEINNAYYRLPDAGILQGWRDAVPSDFMFAVKGSRYITHMKKLKDASRSVTTFLERISVLGEKLGPVLFQLPPNWHCNRERFASFLDMLSGDFEYAFEFRDHSWHNEEIYGLLEARNAAFCIYELDGFLAPKQITADFVYVRLHGPDGPYRGNYDTRRLSGWAGAFSTWSRQGRRIFCYFDNDQSAYAPRNALRLQRMLSQPSAMRRVAEADEGRAPERR
jgi:uncharacterized protein YecE (DUF72 family)